MKNYKLLTPGPLTTTETVKKEMLFDHCTWDDDYKNITQKIRKHLLKLAYVDDEFYTVVLMQGSGTFGVESVISSVISDKDKVLICTNGEYGKRIAQIAKYNKLNYITYDESYSNIISEQKVCEILENDNTITHIAMVHCETTTGILNDIKSIGAFCKKYNKTFIVDAMSSFGGIEIPVQEWNIDFIISSANKCIQGVPGFSFIIANKQKLIESKGTARSLSLDLYDQWECMDKDGKWRYTSPTHVVLAFSKALEELESEGGISQRQKRYTENNKLLIEKMADMGFKSYVDLKVQSPIITSFFYPEHNFTFESMYSYIKERGYAIYPGKLSDANTFRIGNIGEIYSEDIEILCNVIKNFIEENK